MSVFKLILLRNDSLDHFRKSRICLYFSGGIGLRNYQFRSCIGNLTDQKCRKALLLLTCQVIQTHFYSALFASFFHQVVIRYSFNRGGASFLKLMKKILFVQIGVLVDQKWQKFYSYWVISFLQLIFLKNYRFELFYQGVN